MNLPSRVYGDTMIRSVKPLRFLSTLLILAAGLLCSAPAAQIQAQPEYRVFLPFTAVAQPIQLSEFFSYATTQYTSSVVGEVSNLSSTQAYEVTLEAVWALEGDNEPSTRDSLTLPLIAPTTTKPVVFSKPSLHQLLSVSVIKIEPKDSSAYRTLTATPLRLVCSDSGVYGFVEGKVRNTTSVTVSDVIVEVWSLNTSYARGLATGSIEGELKPGEEQVFRTLSLAFCDGNGSPAGVTPQMFKYLAEGKGL